MVGGMKMKCEIRLVCMGNVIALYRREGHEGSVLFSALSEYWQYSNEEDVEEAILQPMSDGNILGILTTAQGQGGIVFIWDTLRTSPCIFLKDPMPLRQRYLMTRYLP